ncbi:MAG: erythrose-4-phosphate dehydrogenase [Endozoicomonadaceae bacterium]|nr:erythrose-4-phosphate dehydrogenase [Endozoicomonadaceae bacterium]
MKYRLAINGYGRIGRNILRAFYERPELQKIFDIVAINEPADIGTMAYLTRFDSVHGRFPGKVSYTDNRLLINNHSVVISHVGDPDELNWHDLNIDLLLECSGTFKSCSTAQHYLDAGPRRLLFSQPAEANVDKTIIFGCNDHLLTAKDYIVSNGSCTTNCIIPILMLLHKHFKIEKGVTTTIHSAMNDQPVIDAYHNTNLRLTRASMQAVIPVETKLSKGIERILPELEGRFCSVAIRVPTINVSLIDLTVHLATNTDRKQINNLFRNAAQCDTNQSVMGYTDEPHASVDFSHDEHSVIIDGTQTQVSNGSLVKIICWFDNEWAFSNRMLDTARVWLEKCCNSMF